MRFRVDLRIFLFLILFYFTRQIEMYLMVLVFGFIHELGHLLAGIIMQMKPNKVSIMPFGLSISFKVKPKDYNNKIGKGNLLELKKIIVAIAGPLTNIIIIFITQKIQLNIFTQIMVIFSNIVIILFNLIPIYPMDGGRILKGILHIAFGKKRAIEYTHKISFIVIILLTVISSIGILYLENVAIIVAIAYVWYIFLNEEKQYKMKKNIYEIIENY